MGNRFCANYLYSDGRVYTRLGAVFTRWINRMYWSCMTWRLVFFECWWPKRSPATGGGKINGGPPMQGGFIALFNRSGKHGGPPKAVINIMADPPQHPWKRKSCEIVKFSKLRAMLARGKTCVSGQACGTSGKSVWLGYMVCRSSGRNISHNSANWSTHFFVGRCVTHRVQSKQ